MDAIFGEIRSITSTPPTPATWEALCALLDTALEADPSRAQAEVFPMAQGQARHWPDAQRVLPARWLWRWMDGALGDATVTVARVVHIEHQHLRPTDADRIPALCDLMRATELHLLETYIEDIDAWRDAPDFLERLTHLTLSWDRHGLELFTWLASLPMPALTHLNLSTQNAGGPGIDALVDAPWLPRLTHLDLSNNNLKDGDLSPLLPRLSPALTYLRLGESQVGPETASALAHTQTLQGLRELHMPHCRIEDSAVTALCETETLGALEVLNLSSNGITSEGLDAIAQSETLLSGLHTLNLYSNDLGNGYHEGMEPLGASPHIGALRHLNVSYNADSHGLLEGLTDNPIADLHTLNLRLSSTPEEECERFAHATKMRNLSSLRFGYGTSTGSWDELDALLSAPCLANLQELDLASLDVDARCLKRLFAGQHHAPMKILWLESSRLDATGFATLLGHPRMAELTELDLQHADWSLDHTALLRDAPCRQTLRRLQLDITYLGDSGARTLFEDVSWPALVDLDLSRDRLTDDGAQALARASMPRLRSLRLWNNELTTDGLETLLQAPWFPGLEDIDLNGNALTDARSFDLLTRTCAMQTLNLSGSASLADQMISSIAETPHMPGLRTLYVYGCGAVRDGAIAVAKSSTLRLTTLHSLTVTDERAKHALHTSPNLHSNLRQKFA